jgi:hypothetical protein
MSCPCLDSQEQQMNGTKRSAWLYTFYSGGIYQSHHKQQVIPSPTVIYFKPFPQQQREGRKGVMLLYSKVCCITKP